MVAKSALNESIAAYARNPDGRSAGLDLNVLCPHPREVELDDPAIRRLVNIGAGREIEALDFEKIVVHRRIVAE